jgi:curved DNA-binding protein CbpA
MSSTLGRSVRSAVRSTIKSCCQCAYSFHKTSFRPYASPDEFDWPQSTNPTPYEIFNLPRTASPAEIKKRYYQLARRYHPDTRFELSGEANQVRLQRFRQVVRANELLSSAPTRRIYDSSGFGWSDMHVSDIMGDPMHWRGNYEGRYRTARPSTEKAEPYYTSNANFAGGIIVIMVLAGVLQISHFKKASKNSMDKLDVMHDQASLNLRDARAGAKGRQAMIDAFQQRRDVKLGVYSEEELEESRLRR